MRAGAEGSGRVGERYRLLAELSRGGMGVVYRALDLATGREIALKRCLSTRLALTVRLFQREYQTLASLRHPRIIEVYDYGIEDGAPFYTMELLDGHDLTELTPVPWRRACGYLMDIATSLLMLHQRKLLHRDLSPRNVRVTSDGFCKLLDFGALTSFGVPTEIVGTPAVLAPELLRLQAMDQRADLFSLGALGYYMLTAVRPYPAQHLNQLEAAWQQSPLAPSQHLERPSVGDEASAIPPALDELLLSLLSIDPLARPVSAAAVIDRLSAIADQGSDGSALSSELYLTGPVVGRDRELAEIETLVANGSEQAAGAILIEGASGAGASRLLRELALHAQLAGAIVVSVDGRASQGPYSTVRAIVRALYDRIPNDASAALEEDAPVLARVFPELVPLSAASAESLAAFTQGTFRAQIQAAILQWWLRLAARRKLVFAVDELQAVDEASAAVLAALASVANGQRLLVACAQRTSDPFAAEAALRVLQAGAVRMRLENLSTDDMQQLLRSLLGDVRHGARFASWLHSLTAGNPGQTIELVRDLIATSAVCHREGVWVVPGDVTQNELPASMEVMQQRRMARISALALQLAQSMSLRDGPLPQDICLQLLPDRAPDEVQAALDELVRENLLRSNGAASYRFAQDIMRKLVLADISAAQQIVLHRRLADCLLSSKELDTQRRMDAGFHLVQAGERSRGAELLRAAALELVDRYDDMIAAAPALEAALEIFRAEGRKPHELLELLMPLCFAGYYVDRRLADRHGDATIALAESYSGLALARSLRPWLGKHLSLWVGLARGLLRYLLTPGIGGFRGFKQLLSGFSTCVVFLAAKHAVCLDAEATLRHAKLLEPLTALGFRSAASFSHRFVLAFCKLTLGHAAACEREFKALLKQLETPEQIADFPMQALLALRGGALYVVGAMQGFRDSQDALETADQLERLGHRIYDMTADQVRVNYYACRAEPETAALYRRKLDAHALSNGSVWQAEVWAPCGQIVADIATDDVVSIKRTYSELQRLTRELPALRRYEIAARLVYLMQTGRNAEAMLEFPDLWQDSGHNSFIGWVTSRGGLAEALITLGRPEEARAVCIETLALLEPDDLQYVALNLRVERQRVRAEIALGNLDAAQTLLDELHARNAPNHGPVTMGHLYTVYMELALARRDAQAFARHAHDLEALVQQTRNPMLVAGISRLYSQARATGLIEVKHSLPVEPGDGLDAQTKIELRSRSAGSE